MPFKSWLWSDNENRRLLLIVVFVMIVSFSWLKILYPYPNFMPPDSNSYIEAANSNQFINIWAIGYSKFLRLVSSITKSHFILVLLQYLLLQASVICFMFTVRYLFSPGKWSFRVLMLVTVLNPLIVHISNFVSSDALFTTLSVVWFTQLLWILHKPELKLLGLHAFIILLAFMVRYTGLYYPFISFLVILFSQTSKNLKIFGIAIIGLFLGIFIGRTQYEYYKKTGTVQFSAFGGWQIAANALYGYAFSKQDLPENVPMRFSTFQKLVNRHMDSLNSFPPFLRPDKEVAVYYLWDFKSPLRVHMDNSFRVDTTTEYFRKWASIAPFYASYGRYIIRHHPKEFVQYYLWPNFIKYYAPPPKFMGAYNMENGTVSPVVATWFGWKDNKLPSLLKDRKIFLTQPFSVLFAVANVSFVLGLVSFLILGGLQEAHFTSRRIIWLGLFVWFANMAFSVFAAPIEMRYQLFPFIITVTFGWFMLEYIVVKAAANRQPNFDNIKDTIPKPIFNHH